METDDWRTSKSIQVMIKRQRNMQDEEDLDGFRSDDESLFSIKQFIFLLEQFI